MLSSIFLAGRLGENKGDGVRIVELDSPLPDVDGSFPIIHVPVYAKLNKRSFFFTAAPGTLIIVKGRLEERPGIGLVVVNEIDEIYSNKAGQVKTTLTED